ncbi:flavoprotein [Mucilaginibacter sp. PPCGB 2223]|uniref:NADPH-dependent FMN reductase n=1 Tax=Mucilaginibacter sp. PPCGB 2223 TaxID=1886027 RepID=UPI0008258BFD|nr:NADPH-dependent FMN reductase [Mucilaginibacter sp. PPCGB 2223]OCX50630.1 flavoprotein [Mucilaginibacter sp. PPCGB 2223]
MKISVILAISGSLRKNSSNGAIINALAAMAPEGVTVTVYEGLANLPHFDPGLDTGEPLAAVADLRKQISEADGVLICTPEYAFGIPAALKNALEWTVSSGEFVDKPTALITASSQGQHGHAALQLVLGAISAKLPEEAKLLIPFIRTRINAEGKVTDAEVLASLQSVLQALIGTINQS